MYIRILVTLLSFFILSPVYADINYDAIVVLKDIGTSTPTGSENPRILDDSIRRNARLLEIQYHEKVLTANGTVTTADSYIIGSSSTAILVSFPPASSCADGTTTKQFVIKNIGVGTMTLSPTVDGVGSPTVSTNQAMTLFTDGTRWMEVRAKNAGDADTLDNIDSAGYAKSGANSDITSLSSVTSLTATTISNTNLQSTTGTITALNSTTGNITNLQSTTGTITNLQSTTGTITTLNSTTGNITNFVATIGTVSTLYSTTGDITNLTTANGTVSSNLGIGGNCTITGTTTANGNVDIAGGVDIGGNVTIDSGIINGVDFISQWRYLGGTGTSVLVFNPGAGIGITSEYDPTERIGTITITGVGTSTAGGWLDTGTQTISTATYPIVCSGTLTVSSTYGVLGLLDRDIPNTISLDNITQIGTRLLSDMQGSVSLATQTSSLLSLGTQTNGLLALGTQTNGLLALGTQTNGLLALGTQTNGLLALGTQTSGLLGLGTQTAGNYIKDWTVGSVLGTGSVNIVTSNYATSSATYSGGSGTITVKTLTRNQIFTSSGNFSVPSDTTQVIVTCVGGGGGGSAGGGGGSSVGGGAGGFIWQFPMTVTPSGTVTVSIGAGGSPGSAGGGNTSFGTLTAYGGWSGGAGGATSVNPDDTAQAGETGSGNNGGAGGDGNWGRGGAGGIGAGVAGSASGWGCGGGGSGFSGTFSMGGTGTAGLCIVNF